jgi:ParB family chromosome partitioning protein
MVAEVQSSNDQDHGTEQVPDWALEWHDPRTLLTDKNIREIEPDAEMIKSVAKVGVLQPIIAVRTVEGQVRVRYGEGRTHAAIAAERPNVPVIVTGAEGDTEAEEIARIIRQRAENTYRQGMSTSEHASAAYQLSLLGLSDKDIADNLQMPQKQVRAANKIGSSQLGSELLDSYDLDLIAAAKIAEFEDDPERVEVLLGEVKRGRSIDETIRGFRRQDKDLALRAKVRAALEKNGIRVLDVEPSSRPNASVRYVSELLDESGNALDLDQHAECPGHAMVIEEDEFYVKADGKLTKDLTEIPEDDQAGALPTAALAGIAICDQANELHPGPPTPKKTDQERAEIQAEALRQAEAQDAARAARRQVIAGNKEWDAAQPGRREWLKKFLQRKTPTADAMEFLTGEMLLTPFHINDGFRDGHPLAADLLGIAAGSSVQLAWETRPAPRRAAMVKLGKDVTDKRRTVLLLALVIGGNEKALSRSSWRPENRKPNEGCPQREYLRFIINHGYPACTVERMAAGLKVDSSEFDALKPAKTKAAEVSDENDQEEQDA